MVRYAAKFCKCKDVKFISHLDLMRCFQRGIRRSGIPIAYSKGFNPHAQFSFATPLPVGTWSSSEYIDMNLDETYDCETLKERLNDALPGGIRLYSVFGMDAGVPSLMSMVYSASYDITLVNFKGHAEPEMAGEFLDREHIEVIKQGKKGESIVDIKPMIEKMELKSAGEKGAVFTVTLDSGSRSNLSPELLVRAVKKYMKGMEDADIEDIAKTGTFFEHGAKKGMLEEVL